MASGSDRGRSTESARTFPIAGETAGVIYLGVGCLPRFIVLEKVFILQSMREEIV
jgi:hypothetical protein